MSRYVSMRPLYLPLEVWSSVKGLLSTSDSSALSLAGLPGSGRLDLRFNDSIGFNDFLNSAEGDNSENGENSKFRSLEAVKAFQRKLKLPSIKSYESLPSDFALENVSEVVLWHLDLMRGSNPLLEPKLCQILAAFPQLKVLEVDLVSVSEDFFKAVNQSQLRELKVEDLRFRSTGEFQISSDSLENVMLNVPSDVKLEVSDCKLLKFCSISSPFSQQPTFNSLPTLQFLRSCSAVVENGSFLTLKSLLELQLDLNKVSPDLGSLDFRNLNHLKLLIATNVRAAFKLPKSLEVLDVLWRSTLFALNETLSSNRKILGLALRCEGNSSGRLQLDLQFLGSLRKLRALFIGWPNELAEEDLIKQFPDLQAMTLWPRKRARSMMKYNRWIQQYRLTESFM